MRNPFVLILITVVLASCNSGNPNYEKNLATAQKFFELHGEEDYEAQVKLISQDVEVKLPMYGSGFVGYDGFLAMIKGYHDTFDDIKYTADVWLPGSDSLGSLNGSVRTYGRWTGVHTVTGKQLDLTGYWYHDFDEQGLIIAQGDFFDFGGMSAAVFPKNLVIVSLAVKEGELDQVMKILESEGGLPLTRAYDGCISLEMTVNKASNTLWIVSNWENNDKYDAYLKWRQTEDKVIGTMIPYLVGAEKGVSVINHNSKYQSY